MSIEQQYITYRIARVRDTLSRLDTWHVTCIHDGVDIHAPSLSPR